ncbi:Beta-hexosaminidase [Trichophyton interdigitale]|uniref:Beta-hexosaminidase n=1 Tax=Trichophyton interdigitale TaxID=101480 RepID=A0A9P4YHD9_9EURO|nr:Beta-hexosaminidase [Trichophyton interdigitale]KAF3899784.1 Beta-hexosaminidase [Trichophyton interdigitale]KAG8211850.1 Beta-hexosaminidase [Trichophyton interdigitale]
MWWIWVAGILGLFGRVEALWPQPSEYSHGNKTLWLSPSVQFTYINNHRSFIYTQPSHAGINWIPGGWLNLLQHPWGSAEQPVAEPLPNVEQFVEDAIKRTKDAIINSKFVPWKFYPRHQKFEPLVDGQHPTIEKVIINETSKTSEEWSPRNYVNGDEKYEIRVSEDGEVQISSRSPIGTIRALQTFQQLFYSHSHSKSYTPFAPVSISDSPKWRHRGLNLDISRNVIRPEEAKRTIDAMASVKLNRLHVHAADSQSWPLDIPSIPELAAKASYHPSQVWSSSELEAVQLYGLERGVSVFLEIDLPGHTAAVGHAFPDLVVAYHMDQWETYAAEPPSGQIKLNSSAVYQFLDRLMADLIPRVSPLTEYFHTGGDEFNLNTYLLELNLGSNDRRVLTPFLKNMITHVHSSLRSSGVTPIVWEELVLDWDLNLPSHKAEGETGGVIVQAWRNSSAVKHVLQKGYQTIFGTGDAWYLDCGVGTFLNPRPGSKAVQDPYLDWCAPTKNWKHMYIYNPLKDIPVELQSLLVGGETHMWSELVDPVNMDQMIWPRTAAAAEVLWTGPRSPDNIQDASYRLAEWRERVVIDAGIRAAMVQMTYCLMRESGCEL